MTGKGKKKSKASGYVRLIHAWRKAKGTDRMPTPEEIAEWKDSW